MKQVSEVPVNRLPAILLSAATLSACVSVTPEGERVRLASESRMVDGCAFVSQVSSSSHWGGIAAQGVAEDNATAELRNQAAQAGGDTLLLVTSRVGMSGARMTGDVYRCHK
jgi:hypothetical protein